MAILRASKLLIVISILIQISHSCEERQQEEAKLRSTAGRLLKKRHHEKDYPPRLSHQPPSVQVAPRRPHTIECPVESQPESEVKWFKDQQVLESQPGRFEQLGSELMFVQTLDEDTGDYSCQASNYLGTVTSEPFRLTVQSTVFDENISLVPPTYLASDRQDRPVEFTCTLPKTPFNQGNSQNIHITWRRNGRPLQVEWTRTPSKSRFQAHSLPGDQSNIIILNIYQVTREFDDNSTYSCAFANPLGSDQEELAHESRTSLLRVESAKAVEDPVKLNIPMGTPVLDANSGESPVDLTGGNQTSGAGGSSSNQRGATATPNGRIKTSLSETLADLYLIAKPTLMIFGSLCLVSVIVLLQFLFIRRRAQRLSHRYLKHGGHGHHHHHHSCSGSSSGGGVVGGHGCDSSGSATSSGASSALGCGEDPVLSSLLARTLSAPSASSLGANATKKYKYYRGKVAAAISPTPPASLFLTRPQREELEKEFRVNPCPSNRVCTALAQCLALSERQVKDWFAVRRVWAKAECGDNNQLGGGEDLLDGPNYFMACENQIPSGAQLLDHQNQNLMYANQGEPAIPNLYNQSVAAREQARSLLGVCERMRSMDNLPTSGQLARQEHPLTRQHNVIMSSATSRFNHNNNRSQQQHMLTDLTMNFNSPEGATNAHNYPFASNKGIGPLESGAASLIQQQQTIWNQQQVQQQQGNEQYQLVSCSSVSPSSSSSIVAASQPSPVGTQDTTSLFTEKPPPPPRAATGGTAQATGGQQQPRDSVTSNHYSIIGANESGPDDGEEDEETRYEELDDGPAVNFRRQQQQQQQSSAQLRASLISSRSGHSNSTTSNSQASESFHTSTTSSRFGSKRSSSQSRNRVQTTSQQHDQLSPYAVSSICHQPKQQQQQQQLPPPMTSEAMRALNEQFDINQLMMMDGANKQEDANGSVGQQQQSGTGEQAPPSLPFSLPPPPTSSGHDESPPRASERSRYHHR